MKEKSILPARISSLPYLCRWIIIRELNRLDYLQKRKEILYKLTFPVYSHLQSYEGARLAYHYNKQTAEGILKWAIFFDVEVGGVGGWEYSASTVYLRKWDHVFRSCQ